jgi:hypothetical protein
LNLLSTNQFGISNYHTLVKPLEDQRRETLEQGADIQRLQQSVKQQQSRTSASGIRGTGISGNVSRRMNYSHYYTFKQK